MNRKLQFSARLIVLFVLLIVAAPLGTASEKCRVDGIALKDSLTKVKSVLGAPDEVDRKMTPGQVVYLYYFSEEIQSDPAYSRFASPSEYPHARTKVTFKDNRVVEVVGRELTLPEGEKLQTRDSISTTKDLLDEEPDSRAFSISGIKEHGVKVQFYKGELMWIKMRDYSR